MKPRYRPMAKAWPREKMIAQWHKVANNPQNARYPLVIQIAQQALDNLHAEPERIAGEDDA